MRQDVGITQLQVRVMMMTHVVVITRYIMSIKLVDHSAENWVSLFNDHAQQLLGYPANDMVAMQENVRICTVIIIMVQHDPAFEQAFANCLFADYKMTLKAKAETYKDEMKLKLQAIKVAKTDPVQESKFLIDQIKKLISKK